MLEAALRNGLLIIPDEKTDTPQRITNAAVGELLSLGYLVNPKDLVGVSTEALTKIINAARIVAGVGRDYIVMYPGFPKQVRDSSTMTLWAEQITHYLTGGEFRPNLPDHPRAALGFEDLIRGSKTVEVVSQSEASARIVESLSQSGVALTENDRVLLSEALSEVTVAEVAALVKNTKMRENAQTIFLAAVERADVSVEDLLERLIPDVRHADFLLRLLLAGYGQLSKIDQDEAFNRAVYQLSDRDAWAVRMSNIPRRIRRAVVRRLGNITVGFRADTLVTRRNLWRKVMSAVHPYDTGSLSEGSARALSIVFEKDEYRTLNSVVETALGDGDAVTAAKVLSENNPAALIRRLVNILRVESSSVEPDFNSVSTALRSVSGRVPVSTLVSAYNGVVNADSDATRLVTTKSGSYLNDRTVEKIGERVILVFADTIMDLIRDGLTTAPEGVVGISSDRPVNLSHREAGTSDRQLDVGEKFAVVGEGDTVRFFQDWHNDTIQTGYVDAGLVFLSDEFKNLDAISWNNWDEHRDYMTYSGDTRVHRGQSAVEFYDVNLDAFRKAHPDARYIVMSLVSWSGPWLSELDIYAGVMFRSDDEAGKLFEPRTVESAFLPMSQSTVGVVQMLDLTTGEMTWLDSSEGSSYEGQSIIYNGDRIADVVNNVVGRKQLTWGELAQLWAQAHDATVTDAPADIETLKTFL